MASFEFAQGWIGVPLIAVGTHLRLAMGIRPVRAFLVAVAGAQLISGRTAVTGPLSSHR